MTSLQDNIDIIQDSLSDIKDAIIYKGGVISGDITSYADDLLNISLGFNREISSQGVFQIPSTSFTFRLPQNAIDIGDKVMYEAFQGCTSLTSVDLSSLTTVSGSQALSYSFSNCTSLTSVDLSSLTTVSGYYALDSAFQECTSLTSADLSSLTTVSGIDGMTSAFTGCSSLTSVDLSSLTTISGYAGMSTIFQSCTSLTSVNLSSLTTISGSFGLKQAFWNTSLTSLSFPSLTSTSFGSYTNQFNDMLKGVTGCTVHFPSNLQSVIRSWSSVTSGFGGTNTSVLFDLPATT